MLIPKHWAEASSQISQGARTLTILRLGWSSDSLEGAQQHARERLEQALAQIRSGEKCPKRDPSSAYGGVDGAPIREEIIEKLDVCTITRNGYGAKCLNVENVLIGDIDLEIPPVQVSLWKRLGVALVLSVALGVISTPLGVLSFFITLALSLKSHQTQVASHRKYALENAEVDALERIRQYVKANPDFHVRIYRSPNGFRVIAMHDVFDPGSDLVQGFFEYLHVDPLYGRMCRKQQCFRARLSSKPWRMALDQWLDLKPRAWEAVGGWPVPESTRERRREWLERYDELSQSFRACRFVEACGSAVLHPVAQKVCDIHDHMSRCHEELPLA